MECFAGVIKNLTKQNEIIFCIDMPRCCDCVCVCDSVRALDETASMTRFLVDIVKGLGAP